ncbi:hypothetical protein PX699_16025 [Sphingobium sp. H39-3-25]|uniref:hypothetical protein n=1 Tax=Sphingobium arseniciresistens TaxID=3030834 RepID=UPI0023B96CA4|nr:hypothetical protein [Sphingobium arseniciresistens]
MDHPEGLADQGTDAREIGGSRSLRGTGVRGSVSNKPLGRFTYGKGFDEDGNFVACEVIVFSLAVKRQLKAWPEIDQRDTRWVPAAEAAALTDEDALKPLLQAFSTKMTAKRKAAPKQKSEERKVAE